MPLSKKLTPDDLAAWHAVTSTGFAHPQTTAQHIHTQHQRVIPLTVHHHTAHIQSASLAGCNPEILKKLSRGLIPYTASLDLHGYLEGDAWLKLNTWLTAAQRHDHRCILLITGKGKGYGPEQNMGLIKSWLPRWLGFHPAVMAYHTATAHDGGSGAVYVYLTRLR